MIHRVKIAADRIGEPALLAHLFRQPRREAAAAEDIVHHIGGNEIRVLPLDTLDAEDHDALRKVADHDLHFACAVDGNIGDFRQPGLIRQISESPVEQYAQFGRRDGTDDGDFQIVLRQNLPGIGQQVVSCDRRNARRRSVSVARIRVVAEGGLVPVVRGYPVGRLAITRDDGRNLSANALHGILVEARLGNREGKEFESLVFPVRKSRERSVEVILVGGEGHARGDFFHADLEGRGIEFARALVEQPRHHIGDARFSFRIGRGPALPGGFHHDHGNFVFLNQPGLDAAGAHHTLDIHRARRQGRKENKAQKCCDAACHPAPPGSSSPVTECVPVKTDFAASITSSFVTSRTRSGHSWIASTLMPVISPSP